MNLPKKPVNVPTFHERLNVARSDTFGHGPARVANIKAALDEERRVHRTSSTGSYDETVAANNIADLEPILEMAEANEEVRVKHAKEREAKQAALSATRRDEAEARLRDELRTSFLSKAGATEQDFDRLYPQLRDAHLLRQDDDARAESRRRVRI